MRTFLANGSSTRVGTGRTTARMRGLKPTWAREAVYTLLQEALDEGLHLDAEAFYQRAQSSKTPVAFATIYRVLTEFEHHGLVQAHTFHGMRKVYELEAGQPRDHLVNVVTGEIHHLSSQQVDTCCAALAKEHGVEVVRRSLTLYVHGRAPRRTTRKPPT